MMKLLLACTVVLGLTGCEPTNPSYTDVNRNYSVRPENLKDCDISVIEGPGVNPITIARCPLSSTTTSQMVNVGKTQIQRQTIVIDGVTYQEVKK